MSKAVTREQGLAFGGKLMRGGELFETVKKVWFDETNLPALARSYAGHHQLVCAVLANKGGNDYLNETKGLSFGIRKTFMTTEDKQGVILVPLPPSEAECTTTNTSTINKTQATK